MSMESKSTSDCCDNDKIIISLSGGGLNGMAYLGMFLVFEEYNLSPSQFIFYGTSIGGILSTFWAMGYNAFTMIKLFADFNYYPECCFENFILNGGFDSAKKYEQKIKDFLNIKYPNTNMTLKDIPNVNLLTCNLSTKKLEVLNSVTYPELPIHIALRMTSNLPLLFEPYLYNSHYYVDGAVMENVPIPRNTINDDPIIFCSFKKNHTDHTKNLSQFTFFNYIQSLLECATMTNNTYVNFFKNRINILFDKVTESYDLWLPIELKNKQIRHGYYHTKSNTELINFINKIKLKIIENMDTQN